MTHPYGAIATRLPGSHTEDPGVESDEVSALLLKHREGHASVISSVSNLSNTIIGSGGSFYLLSSVSANGPRYGDVPSG